MKNSNKNNHRYTVKTYITDFGLFEIHFYPDDSFDAEKLRKNHSFLEFKIKNRLIELLQYTLGEIEGDGIE